MRLNRLLIYLLTAFFAVFISISLVNAFQNRKAEYRRLFELNDDKKQPVHRDEGPQTTDFRSSPGVSVLCYHQILSEAEMQEKPTAYGITLEQFREQMQTLYEEGYRTIHPDILADHIKNGTPLPAGFKPVIITFDDGLNDFTRYGAPVLKQYNFKAVLFIYPTYIMAGKKRGMTWQQIRQAAAEGHIIGSHTFWHPLLNTMSAKEQLIQFKRSAEILEKYTGERARYLAYPFGVFTAESEELLKKSGYKGAFTIFHGENTSTAAPYRLNRYMVTRNHTLKTFKKKLQTRSLPVTAETAAGSFISNRARLEFKLPADLDKKNLSVRVYSRRPSFSYDSATGLLSFSIPGTDKKIILVEMRYSENNTTYRAEFMYNSRRHRGS